MYAVEVRDHVMIAHSLPDPVFGPAQGLHGATYVVDAAFFAATLDAHGIVVDIGRATAELAAALAPLRYANLDELPAFAGRITTTEVICAYVFDALRRRGPRRAARRRRPAEPAAGDAAREPRRARLVRGRPLVPEVHFVGPGRARHPDRRLRLRPAAAGGAAGAAAGPAPRPARRRLAVPRARRTGRGRRRRSRRSRTARRCSATGSPSG